MSDEDSVAELLKRQSTDGDDAPPMSFVDWTPERDLLTTIGDILNQLHATLIAANSKNGDRPSTDPLPRPVSVVEKVERRQIIELHDDIVSKFLPGRQIE